MAYWWVSQNKTYRHERDGGFLWAPNQTEAGLARFHWETMNEVRPGDVIFSYVGSKIVAVSVAKTAAYERPRPGRTWARACGRTPASGSMWSTGTSRSRWPSPGSSPKSGPPARALLAAEPIRHGQPGLSLRPSAPGGPVLARPDRRRGVGQATVAVEEGIGRAARDATERRALVLSRIGQGQFREALMSIWDGRCAVTGLDLPVLLRAFPHQAVAGLGQPRATRPVQWAAVVAGLRRGVRRGAHRLRRRWEDDPVGGTDGSAS